MVSLAPHQETCTVIYKNLILPSPVGAHRIPNGHQTSYRVYLDRKLFNTSIERTKRFLSCNHLVISTSDIDQYEITLCCNCGIYLRNSNSDTWAAGKLSCTKDNVENLLSIPSMKNPCISQLTFIKMSNTMGKLTGNR